MEYGFRFHVQEKISQMAWCAVIERGQAVADVYCGSSVACTKSAFVEGAWDGDYAEMNFADASFFCGSGGKIVDGADKGYCFATANHVLEKIVIIQKENTLYVSNSVPFVLAKSGCRLDREYAHYERDFNSILDGLDDYRREVPLAEGMTLQCYYYCNIYISSKGDVKFKEKKPVPPVKSYQEYMDTLLEDMEKLRDNATAREREFPLGITTTVSTGYDAPACAVVARKIGCNTALTFDSPQKYACDCGDKVAECLGYKHIIKKNADEYRSRTDLIEAEHVCSGELGTGIIFSAFEEEFHGNLVFYGERGDRIWRRNYPTPNDRFIFDAQYAGIFLCETRLRIGFVLVPMPLYKAAVWTSIHAVSNSPEMAAWSVGGNYDRPIPRRMLEEAGVGREMFGQSKRGAGFNYHYDNMKRLRKRMTEASYKSFEKYVKTHKRHGQFGRYCRFYYESMPSYINYFLRKVGIKKRLKSRDKKIFNPGAPSYLINWGMDVMIERYSVD